MPCRNDPVRLFENSLFALHSWLLKADYKAYDPFDGLDSFLRPLTFHLKKPQQILQQLIRRSPINLRSFVGIKPHTSTKGMSFLASGYLKLYLLTKKEEYKSKAVSSFEWLMNSASKGYSGYCWGNAFDYISRGFYLPKGSPTLVWSGLIGHHFIEAFRVLGDPTYLEVAIGVGQFVIRDLPRIPQAHGVCISYVCQQETAVHNANLLGARFLAELHRETGDSVYLELAMEAARYSVHAQLPSGAWYYGEDPKFHWIDNWHTAYNLDSLLDFQRNTESHEFEREMLKGLDFYENNFFREDGAPKYYWDREYKLDIQSSSQAIDTLTLFGRHLSREDLIDKACKTATWTIRNMQDESGYFYLWKNKRFTNKTPTFHWGGTTMFHALAHLLLEMSKQGN